MIDASALPMVLVVLTGWLDRQERQALAYLMEENRVLRRQWGPQRLQFTDADRRRLAVRGHRLGRQVLRQIATLVTLGSTPHPNDFFVRHVGRSRTGTDGLLSNHRVLIWDRDRKWSGEVRRLLGDAGVHIVQAPFQAPNANAYAERLVRSITHECLNRMVPLGERHFRQALQAFVDHDHRERNHKDLRIGLSMGTRRDDAAAEFVGVRGSVACCITTSEQRNDRRQRGASARRTSGTLRGPSPTAFWQMAAR